MRRPSSSPLVVSLLLATSAAAHVGPQAGRFPFVEDGVLVGGGTSWGLVLDDSRTGTGPFARVCEESLRTQNVYVYARVASGRILAGVLGGLRFSDDGGCSWQTVAGPFSDAELDVTSIAIAADAPDVWYVTTGRYGFDNGVYKTTNGGASFTATGVVLEHDGEPGAAVLFDVITSPDGARAWVSGLDADLGAPMLRFTDDGGATWGEPVPDLSAFALLSVLGVDGDRVVLGGLNGQGSGILMSATWDLTVVDEVDTFPNEITHFARDGDTRLLVVRTTLMRAGPGETTYSIVPDVALTCVVKVPGEPGVWGCGQAGGSGQFLSSSDGLAWTSALGFAGIEERACPICTDGAVCPSFLPDAGPVAIPDAGADACLVDAGQAAADAGVIEDAGALADDAGHAADDDAGSGGDPDAGAPGDDDGVCACGATTSSSGAPLTALAALAAGCAGVARRRRARR